MRSRKRFVSYRLRGEYEKPWLADPKFKRTKVNNYIIWAFIALGIAAAGAVAYLEIRGSLPQQMCLVFEDDFQGDTLDESNWNYEVALDGFGTGSFDWTTTDPTNVYVDDKGLHIVPTLTNETTSITTDQMWNGFTLNLTADGTCTETSASACVVTSNSTLGNMVNPVRSARVNTQGKVGLKYGRVEVEAKIPQGDWLWPAIWMMPTDSVYGTWPKSGEMDIMEARGNGADYEGGRNVYYSTLHWGLSSDTDAYWKTQKVRTMRRGYFSEATYTYGLEWDDKYIYTYFDSRLTQVLYVNFYAKDPLWDRGDFSASSENDTLATNPWVNSTSTTGNAPFDQEFYLILNVAVGAKDGWFPDNKGNKPWLDDATNAQWTFWSDVGTWLPTWGKGDARGLTVRSVKMWERGVCGSTPEL
ncbi:family 16 glycoside hydrolase [Cryphonectria parasitica EP155]|uniref:Family 16 glycoside hydrolase n=1 Tax=Cryphonectria parasitica (strain ATCC 38755 / EP155) TaxID=660469 RepID=A0A9P4Y9L9_CRYP1|nr:family 16 glycoside hydrolase [Cryphonectria parasitica EP155]KAF3769509.1 family 16 glycoside hydrolase [Cryphonectria parasitica EP155]